MIRPKRAYDEELTRSPNVILCPNRRMIWCRDAGGLACRNAGPSPDKGLARHQATWSYRIAMARRRGVVQLYLGSSEDFIKDSVQNEIAKKLGDSFYEYYRFRANISEFNSWQNSLRALSAQIMYADVRQTGIIL